MTRADLCGLAAKRQTQQRDLVASVRRLLMRLTDCELLAARDECRCSRQVVRMIEDEMAERLGGMA